MHPAPAVALLLAAAFAGCVVQEAPDARETAVVRFIAVGDVGTGTASQYAVADAMETVCDARGCDLVLMLGDNLYEHGPASPTDDQFRTKFEQPYAGLDLPFYPVMGNHDYGGSGTGFEPQNAAFEVGYTAQSDKWTMPATYHAFTVGPVRFLALDSGLPNGVGTRDVPDAPGQATWLAQQVANETAPWTVAFAHHPYKSNGRHGDAGDYDGTAGRGDAWKALLEGACPALDVFFAGHDHDLQWLEPAAPCDETELVVSGAGAKQRSAGAGSHPARFEAFDTYGFVWVEATPTTMTVAFYDDGPTLLHEGALTA